MKLGDQCVPVDPSCTFQCPPNARRIPDQDCYDAIDDCECDFGYMLVGDSCVPEDVSCNFQCPDNARRLPDRGCYDNFDDCECDFGFERNEMAGECDQTEN